MSILIHFLSQGQEFHDSLLGLKVKNQNLETTPLQNFENQARENESRKGSLFPRFLGYLRNTLVSSTKQQDVGTIKTDFVEEMNDGYLDEESLTKEITDDGGDQVFLYNLQNKEYRKVDSVMENVTEGKRDLPVYLFQGHYLAEPRLNRFIDGAMENLGQEMKLSVLDPVFFRVLPKGKVIGRPKPIKVFPTKQVVQRRRRKPFLQNVLGIRQRHQRPIMGRSLNYDEDDDDEVESGRQRKPNQKQTNQKRRKGPLSRGVGGGRIEGLSRVTRDGDAEMQLFGNYTLIRSHYNMGPVYLVMQFRTIRGSRRAVTTLERVKVHTVTRVNTQGCEMIDFLLDRPHSETIKLRNELFPLANRVAQNIFSRLFAPDSFLVARIREKTGLALLSKKTSF